MSATDKSDTSSVRNWPKKAYRPGEEIGGRRWSETRYGSQEFASAVQFATVLPSEFDRIEVGHRVARAHAEQVAQQISERHFNKLVQVLHPAEFARVRPTTNGGSAS